MIDQFPLLAASGLNQSEFAAKCKITQSAVSHYCSGREPDIRTLEKIAIAFGIRVSDVLLINSRDNARDAALELLIALMRTRLTLEQVEAMSVFLDSMLEEKP